jgi:signal transduction histidine kinase
MEKKRRLRPRTVLFAGFGGLLAFLIASAGVTFYLLDRVRNDDRRFRQTFVERLGVLERIRAQIYLSGTYVRDYLLSPDTGGADAQRARLAAIEEESQEVLNRYAKGIEASESDVFEALRSEIGNYWSVLHTTFDWTPQQRNRLRFTFFYEQLVPRRTTMLQIADTIEGIHQRGLSRAEERFTASADNLRLSLMAMFGVALTGSLLLALGAIALTLRLERENAQARADLENLSARLVRTQEEERRSLARELHDEVGQSLSAIMMEAGNAEFAESPGDTRDRMRTIASMAEKTLTEVRDLALLLRPSMLDDFGLVPALNWQAREMSKRTGLNIAVEAGEDCDSLPEEHRTCIYRMAQEALNNAARHASAQTVRVAVRNAGNRVLFLVRDDGTGFDKKVVRGLGLLGMEERVRSLGGWLKIDSQPGRGTTISAELPFSETVVTEAHAATDPHPVG